MHEEKEGGGEERRGKSYHDVEETVEVKCDVTGLQY
jgi:hypothetical protein